MSTFPSIALSAATAAVLAAGASSGLAQSEPRREPIKTFPLSVKQSAEPEDASQAAAVERELNRVKLELETAEAQLKDLREQADEKGGSKRIRNQLTEKLEEIEQLERTNRKLEAALRASERELRKQVDEKEDLEATLSKVKQQLDEAEDELAKARKGLLAYRKENAGLSREVADLEKDLASAKKKRSSRDDDSEPADDAAAEEIEQLRKQLAEQKELSNKYKRYAVSLKALVKQQSKPQAVVSAETAAPVPALPADADPLTLGNALLARGDARGALQVFREASETARDDEESANLLVGLASSYHALGKNAAASDICREVLKEDRKHVGALGLMGVLAYAEGDLKAASRYLDKSLDQDPDQPDLQAYMGIVQFSLGRAKSARKHLETAIELNPKDANSHYNLAVLLSEERDPNLALAREHYRESVGLGAERDEHLEQLLEL